MEKTNNKAQGILSKKCKGSFQCRVSLKSEWKGSHPVRTVKGADAT